MKPLTLHAILTHYIALMRARSANFRRSTYYTAGHKVEAKRLSLIIKKIEDIRSHITPPDYRALSAWSEGQGMEEWDD